MTGPALTVLSSVYTEMMLKTINVTKNSPFHVPFKEQAHWYHMAADIFTKALLKLLWDCWNTRFQNWEFLRLSPIVNAKRWFDNEFGRGPPYTMGIFVQNTSGRQQKWNINFKKSTPGVEKTMMMTLQQNTIPVQVQIASLKNSSNLLRFQKRW